MATRTSSAVEILDTMFGGDPEMVRLIQKAAVAMDFGQSIHDAREAAGLTQEDLAARIGLAADELDGLEMGDFEQVPLGLLERIAAALDKRLEIRLSFNSTEGSARRTA